MEDWPKPLFDFPPAEYADENGLLAVGGDLQPASLISAYQQGIFPWFNEGEPILWWCPDPRYVLFPSEIKVAKSMRPLFNQRRFEVTYDQAFPEVLDRCKRIKRKDQPGTWITPDMQKAYITLHELGIGHSVEVWQNNQLVGGLYGVSLGKIFFGESMFSEVSNASKFGFITLAKTLEHLGFLLIDCQVQTEHLESLGARPIPREEFLSLLKSGIEFDSLRGNWHNLSGFTKK